MRSIFLVAVLAQSAFAQDPVRSPSPSPQGALALRLRLARLLNLPLVEREAGGPRVVKAAVVPLACQVLGTLQSKVVELSLASVQCGKSTRSVRVGDAIEDSVVEEIGFGTVTVRRGDHLELLGRGIALAASNAPFVPPTRASLEEGRVPRTLVDDVLKNPAQILGEVQLLPAFNGGKWAGLRATYVKDGSVIATLGLKKGDVLKTVNGKALDSVQAAMTALTELTASSEISVDLDRGGQVVTKRLRIE